MTSNAWSGFKSLEKPCDVHILNLFGWLKFFCFHTVFQYLGLEMKQVLSVWISGVICKI